MTPALQDIFCRALSFYASLGDNTFGKTLRNMEKYVGFITQDLRAGIAIIFVCCILICVACLLDLWTGIDAARANKEKIRSKPLRKDRHTWFMFPVVCIAVWGRNRYVGSSYCRRMVNS